MLFCKTSILRRHFKILFPSFVFWSDAFDINLQTSSCTLPTNFLRVEKATDIRNNRILRLAMRNKPSTRRPEKGRNFALQRLDLNSFPEMKSPHTSKFVSRETLVSHDSKAREVKGLTKLFPSFLSMNFWHTSHM